MATHDWQGITIVVDGNVVGKVTSLKIAEPRNYENVYTLDGPYRKLSWWERVKRRLFPKRYKVSYTTTLSNFDIEEWLHGKK